MSTQIPTHFVKAFAGATRLTEDGVCRISFGEARTKKLSVIEEMELGLRQDFINVVLLMGLIVGGIATAAEVIYRYFAW